MAQAQSFFNVLYHTETISDIVNAFAELPSLYQHVIDNLVLPDLPNTVVDGKTISAWTTDWWQWALQAPAGQGPLDSAESAATHYNNDGKIFFIAGGPDATITVAAGKPILFPMVNIFDTEGPGLPPSDPGFQGSYDAASKRVTDLGQANITDAFAKITKDGHTLLNIRWPLSAFFAEKSDQFAIGVPQDGSYLENLLGSALPLDDAIKDLPFSRSAGDWLMLNGLKPGTYTLDFGGSIAETQDPVTGSTVLPAFSVHTTDTLIVS